MQVRAVLFDYSGTLFRLEEDDSWFEGMQVDEREVDGHVQAELMRRLTAPDRPLRRHDTRRPTTRGSTATSRRTCTARRICMCCANPGCPTIRPRRCTTG